FKWDSQRVAFLACSSYLGERSLH
ncbi:DUF3265 domain-containing protein, partial [Vibrio cholerae]|nr:DUF3265 domain-containing protein [Vibrio cholerae]